MTKTVFRQEEIANGNIKVYLNAPQEFIVEEPPPVVENVGESAEAEVTSYDGPTVDDLKREAELFKSQWGTEREAMIRSAQIEADGIIKNAEAVAFQEVKRRTDEAQSLKREAQDAAEKITAEAERKATETVEASSINAEALCRAAEDRSFRQGREAGFNEGKAEVARLIERTQTVLERAQEKRAEIFAEAEKQLIDLALLISRKVIKILSENQKEVLIANVTEALHKVKSKGEVVIRVNTADIKLSTEHTQDFIQALESGNAIQIQEDTSVDQGGCIIETDFGEIDARISSQMAELEARILEIAPIRSKDKAGTEAASR
ncbi:MAG: flagellar assembly protein FliH [Treponema sp.]|jgi:flagellar assembly protein FliH|nr:flagellar assembly protein FliH [Treponema sp.]